MSQAAQQTSVFRRNFTNVTPSSGSSAPAYTRVNHYRSPWALALSEKLDALVSLEKGWDGYAGKPVSFKCAWYAADIINRLCSDSRGLMAPSLIPGSDGSLQIEWHTNQYDVEIDIHDVNEVIATRFDQLGLREEELLIRDSDFTQISEWIRDLETPREAVGDAQ